MQLLCFNCGKVNRLATEQIEPGVPCQQCRKALIKPEATNLSDEQLRNAIREDQLPLVVDFWAPWCAPCRSMAAAVTASAKRTVGELRFAKLNTDDYPAIAKRHHVKSLPTLVLFRRRKEVSRLTGAKTQKQILQWIRQHQ